MAARNIDELHTCQEALTPAAQAKFVGSPQKIASKMDFRPKGTCVTDSWLSILKIWALTYPEEAFNKLFKTKTVGNRLILEITDIYRHPKANKSAKAGDRSCMFTCNKLIGSDEMFIKVKELWISIYYGQIGPTETVGGTQYDKIYDFLRSDNTFEFTRDCHCAVKKKVQFHNIQFRDYQDLKVLLRDERSLTMALPPAPVCQGEI